jgi:hypothetical protein
MRVPEWAIENIILYPDVLSEVAEYLRKNERKKGLFRKSSQILDMILSKLPKNARSVYQPRTLESMAGRKLIWWGLTCQKQREKLLKENRKQKIKTGRIQKKLIRINFLKNKARVKARKQIPL